MYRRSVDLALYNNTSLIEHVVLTSYSHFLKYMRIKRNLLHTRLPLRIVFKYDLMRETMYNKPSLSFSLTNKQGTIRLNHYQTPIVKIEPTLFADYLFI